MPRICLLDPSINARDGAAPGNLGDLIIRQAVVSELTALLPGFDWVSIPTQLPLTRDELQLADDSDLLVVGGTNLLSSHMLQYQQWQISPADAVRLGRVVLMGAGWWQYQDDPDQYTRDILQSALSTTLPHSVRDQYTRQKLSALGLEQVINTACPTMWQLTPQRLQKIPIDQAEDVLVTLTDYHKNRPLDRYLLDLLFSQYRRVYFWPQGSGDARYIAEFEKPVIMLDRTLPALEQLLDRPEPLDCIGTRLHGGIKAMQHGRRTLIIGIDNRATEIASDTGLPVAARGDEKTISTWIASSKPIALSINQGNVERWKRGFAEHAGVGHIAISRGERIAATRGEAGSNDRPHG